MIMPEISTTAKIRVLWLTENYPPQRGGMSVSCDRIVRGLRQNNIEIDVAHFSPRFLRWKTEKRINGLQFACPVDPDISHTLNRFWGLIEDKHYTHIVAFGGLLPLISAPIYSKWIEAPQITMIRGNDFDSAVFSPKRSGVLRRALENSESICVVSKDKADRISRLYPEKPVCWTPNGIDITEWEFSPEDRILAESWRRENGVGKKRVLGLFGQIKRKKGGLFFLKNLLRSGCADKIHVLLVGDMEAEMHQLLDEDQGQLSFSHLDFLDRFELLPYYAACDFIAIPSFYDGMPNVLLESAALEIPVLASNADGMKDLLTDGVNSILFRPGDDFDCQRAIQTFARIDRDIFAGLKKNIYSTALDFDIFRESSSYLRVFRETTNPLKKGVTYA
jgi:glycosyltransferase involved in cell wall biosynthesis